MFLFSKEYNTQYACKVSYFYLNTRKFGRVFSFCCEKGCVMASLCSLRGGGGEWDMCVLDCRCIYGSTVGVWRRTVGPAAIRLLLCGLAEGRSRRGKHEGVEGRVWGNRGGAIRGNRGGDLGKQRGGKEEKRGTIKGNRRTIKGNRGTEEGERMGGIDGDRMCYGRFGAR